MKFLVTIACAALAAAAPAAKSPKAKESHSKHGKIKAMDTDAPNGNKKGLVYNDASVIGAFNGAASWAYNWASAIDASGVQGIPMCWGGGVDCDANGINAKIDQGNTPWVLGYNEPDMPKGDAGGSQMTPQQAYDSWGNDMFRFRDRGVKLVCPGISSYDTDNSMFTGYASGLTWLRQWANINGNPSEFGCDAQALHWYGAEGVSGADQGQLFISYIENAHNIVNEIFGREMDIWVTEFSPVPTNDAGYLSDFLAVTIPWLDAQNYVARYSPFKAEYMVSGGQLNQAGQTFVNVSK